MNTYLTINKPTPIHWIKQFDLITMPELINLLNTLGISYDHTYLTRYEDKSFKLLNYTVLLNKLKTLTLLTGTVILTITIKQEQVDQLDVADIYFKVLPMPKQVEMNLHIARIDKL